MTDFTQFLTLPFLLTGALVTLEVAAGAFVLALIVGTVLATVQLRHIPVLSAATRVYAIITRGTPLLLQLLFVYDVLPAFGLRFSEVVTAIAVMGLSTATFFSEILRGAVTSLDRDQVLAAESLGMRPLVVARRVIAPQAIRIALPNLANQVVVLILSSSLASTISVAELTLRSQELSAATFKVLAVYSASSLMYLVLTSAVALVELWFERLLALEAAPVREPVLRQWARRVLQLTSATMLGWVNPVRAGGRGKAAFAEPGSASNGQVGRAMEDELELVDSRVHLQAIGNQLIALHEPDRRLGPMLDIRNIVKAYGPRSVLRDVSLQVDRGQVVVIMGPSGCGKSTLLRCIARLEKFESGEIFVEGSPFGVDARGSPLRGRALAEARARARIAMVFQHFELFFHMTAMANVTAAPRFAYGASTAKANQQAATLLDAVGLAEHAHDYPHQLSGGQQQRAAIARALAISPRVILLDEPTSALDPLMVHEVLVVLRHLAALGMTMVVVTHEVGFARDVADRVVFMQHGQVVESGQADEILERPQVAATRNFLRILEH